MIEDIASNPWATAGAGVSALITGAMWLRTKLARDASTIANERAEVDMIERLQQENTYLRTEITTIAAERNQLYREVGELVGSIRALEQSQKLMEEHIAELKGEIQQLRDALERTATP